MIPWSGLIEEPSDSGDFADDLPEVLPNLALGWLFLQKSGLDQQGRNALLAAMKNNMDLGVLESAMRAQWTDDEIRERDVRKGRDTRRQHAHAALGADAETWECRSDSEEFHEYYGEEETGASDEDDEQNEEALETHDGQQEKRPYRPRTLHEARRDATKARLGRDFYPAKGNGPRDGAP